MLKIRTRVQFDYVVPVEVSLHEAQKQVKVLQHNLNKMAEVENLRLYFVGEEDVK